MNTRAPLLGTGHGAAPQGWRCRASPLPRWLLELPHSDALTHPAPRCGVFFKACSESRCQRRDDRSVLRHLAAGLQARLLAQPLASEHPPAGLWGAPEAQLGCKARSNPSCPALCASTCPPRVLNLMHSHSFSGQEELPKPSTCEQF